MRDPIDIQFYICDPRTKRCRKGERLCNIPYSEYEQTLSLGARVHFIKDKDYYRAHVPHKIESCKVQERKYPKK